LRHLPWAQYTGQRTPQWHKHTAYLDGILQVPVGQGTIKVHGFVTSGRRWTSTYTKMGAWTEDEQSNDKTQGIIAEYRDINLFDSHRLTVGAEYQELGWPPDNPIIYKVQSAYAQDVISLGDRWKITPGVRYYHVDMDTYYVWFEEAKAAPAFPTTGKEQEDDGFYPSLKVDFQATPETALYAAVSRSYRLPCP